RAAGCPLARRHTPGRRPPASALRPPTPRRPPTRLPPPRRTPGDAARPSRALLGTRRTDPTRRAAHVQRTHQAPRRQPPRQLTSGRRSGGWVTGWSSRRLPHFQRPAWVRSSSRGAGSVPGAPEPRTPGFWVAWGGWRRLAAPAGSGARGARTRALSAPIPGQYLIWLRRTTKEIRISAACRSTKESVCVGL